MELQRYLASLRKWWWLIAAATLLAAGGTYLGLLRQPAMYEAHATLIAGRAIDDPNPTTNQFTSSQLLAQTYADLARREPVRNAVRNELGLRTLPKYTATALPQTQLLEIVVTDTSPERAQAVAMALAQELISLSPGSLQPEEQERQKFVQEQLDKLEVQIEETEAEIEAKQAELAELFSAQLINEAQTQINALETKRNTLQSNFAALLSSGQQDALNTLTLVEPATLPQAPVDPRREISLLIAAAVGLGLGVAAASLLEFADDSIRSQQEIEAPGVPMLTAIPRCQLRKGESELVTIQQPRSPAAEAFRALRTDALFMLKKRSAQTMLTTSPSLGDGKSMTTANLAVVLAQARLRVLLIDADLRRPKQHRIFKVINQRGFTNLLSLLSFAQDDGEVASITDAVLSEMVRATPEPNLQLLTSGPIYPNPSELLASDKLKLALHEFSKHYDLIILDSSAFLPVTDAAILSSLVDSVLLIARAGATRRSELRATLDRLTAIGVKPMGLTLTDLSPKSRDYYYERTYALDPNQAEEVAPAATGNGRPKWANSFFQKEKGKASAEQH
ncbi:MAG: polysaccharide biosynthesis tyrosine autokinase [Candidatus Promineifilaceae bacterium]